LTAGPIVHGSKNGRNGIAGTRLIWFEEPAEALSDTVRFVAYALAHAKHEDMNILRGFLTDDNLREALDRAPPGVIDPRLRATGTPSWGAIPRRHCQRGGWHGTDDTKMGRGLTLALKPKTQY
jgi:hypothetical protein